MIKSKEAQRLLDSLTTAVMLFDKNGALCSMNTAAESLLSCSARQILGSCAEKVVPGVPEFSAAVTRGLETGASYTERNMQIILAPGNTIYVDCIVSPVHTELDGATVLVELSNADWHQRVLREENIIAQHNVSSALVRGMAHEIKNPLGGLRGAAQLLERELHSEELKEYTRIIIQEADRLRKLLDRMSGPKALPDKKDINIHEILEHVRQLVSAETSRCIKIERDYDPSIPNLLADRDQLIQAFLNVVRNAAQSIGNRPGTIKLCTRTERQFTIGLNRYRLVLRVDVIDDGPGIPSDIKESIFYPMVTGREEGTGLGLSIAQSMAHYHDGVIACQSVPGNTCFTIWLPLSRGTKHES